MKNTLKIALLSAATTLAVLPSTFASGANSPQQQALPMLLDADGLSPNTSRTFSLTQIREAAATEESKRSDAHKKALEFAEAQSEKIVFGKGFNIEGLEILDDLLKAFPKMVVAAGLAEAKDVNLEDGDDLSAQSAGFMYQFVQDTAKLTALIDQIAALQAEKDLGIVTTSSPTSVEILEGLKAYIGVGGGVSLGGEAGDDEEQQQASQSQALLTDLQYKERYSIGAKQETHYAPISLQSKDLYKPQNQFFKRKQERNMH